MPQAFPPYFVASRRGAGTATEDTSHVHSPLLDKKEPLHSSGQTQKLPSPRPAPINMGHFLWETTFCLSFLMPHWPSEKVGALCFQFSRGKAGLSHSPLAS